MNKETLFHGKRVDNGEWAEGDLLHGYCSEKSTDIASMDISCTVEVIPETVGQYIGKDDKNGKKIFDGAILKGHIYPFYASNDNTFNYYAVVIWFEETCSYRLVAVKAPNSNGRGISEGNDYNFEEFQSEDWEIIGNVHDNPELLPEWILSSL